MPYRMTQVRRLAFRATGASGSDFFDGVEVAKEAWGDACEVEGSTHSAFAYLSPAAKRLALALRQGFRAR